MTRSSDTSREGALLGCSKRQLEHPVDVLDVVARSGHEPCDAMPDTCHGDDSGAANTPHRSDGRERQTPARGAARLGFVTSLLTLLCASGCIRFHYDAPAADAGADAEQADAEQADAELADADDEDAEGTRPEAAPPPPPPLCQGRDVSIADKVAADTVAALLQDCHVGAYFNTLPGIKLDHFEQCFAAQLGSALGCVRGDGSKVKYPTFDGYREICRDMKSAHAALTASDGDYEAFMSVFVGALTKNQFNTSEITRITRAYGSTRSDIVRLKDAGPTRACDAGADAAH